ncbi:hypothetical protein N8987_02595 [Crocinitomix sp.]|nr:hypothetical protein [Crocinitomix sp.]
MIDYQKTKVLGVNPEHWRNHIELEFERKFIVKTGEIDTKEIASYLGLEFIIYYNHEQPDLVTSMWVKGSLHKYYCRLNGIYAPNQYNDYLKLKGYNGNNFTYLNFCEVLDDLENRFYVDFRYSSLHNIEYGINIKHELTTALVLDGFILHNGVFFNSERGRLMYMQRAKKTQYEIKVYDKGLQYGELENVIRFEKKVRKMEHIKKLGINNLNDLRNLNKWEVLFHDLLKCWEELLFIDNLMKLDELSEIDIIKVKDYKNPSYWTNIQPNRRDVHKKRYKAIELKHRANTKEIIRERIKSAYYQLVRIDSSVMESNITHYKIITTHYGLVG